MIRGMWLALPLALGLSVAGEAVMAKEVPVLGKIG